MLILLALFQAAAAQPDIELNVRARARSVEVQQKGEARLEVRGGEGSSVEARVSPKGGGRTKLRNVTVDIRAEARLGEGAEIRAEAETGTPR